MAFWNKKSKASNKAPTDALYSGVEDEVHELDKFPYFSSSTEPTSSSLYSGGTGLLGSYIIGPPYTAYSSPTPRPTTAGIDPMSLLIFKEGDDIVLKSRQQVPLYKLSKAELELIVPKGAISIASLLLLFLEESEKLENND